MDIATGATPIRHDRMHLTISVDTASGGTDLHTLDSPRHYLKVDQVLISVASPAFRRIHTSAPFNCLLWPEHYEGPPTSRGRYAWHGTPRVDAPNYHPTGKTSDGKQRRAPTGYANTTPTVCAAPTLAPNCTTQQTTQTIDSKHSNGSAVAVTAPRHNAKHAQHKPHATQPHANANQRPTPDTSNPTTTHPGGAPRDERLGPTGLAITDLRARKSFFSGSESG